MVAVGATGFYIHPEASVAPQCFDGEENQVGVGVVGRRGERVRAVGQREGMAHQGAPPQGPNEPVIPPGASYQDLQM